MFPKTRWFGPDLTMVLHDYGTNILFAMGTASIREALDHVTWPVHLQVQQDALDEIGRYATIEHQKLMWRMSWSERSVAGGTEVPPLRAARRDSRGRGGTLVPPGQAQRLSHVDVPALQALYGDGDATGEAPDFFHPSMVNDGVFFGVYDGPTLVAAAGTHLFAPEEDAVAIGNIYTMRDRRGRGLGRIATMAVLEAVKDIKTVGLNVRADNLAALRLYESIGFVRHCPFYEGQATGWR
jgi:ribosomal protein S18 acetylase RimI-like enzyme